MSVADEPVERFKDVVNSPPPSDGMAEKEILDLMSVLIEDEVFEVSVIVVLAVVPTC